MKFRIREIKKEDLNSVLMLEQKTWGTNAATKENLDSRFKVFPSGNLVAETEGKIIGFVSAVIINNKTFVESRTWYDYTDNGNINAVFDKEGDILFGISLTVDPDFRQHKVGSKLLLQIARMAIEHRVKFGVLGGRIPYYHKYMEIPVEEYILMKNKKGKILDPELRLYRRMGLEVVKVQKDYFRDPDSLNYGVILKWNNPFYHLTKRLPFFARPLSFLFKI